MAAHGQPGCHRHRRRHQEFLRCSGRPGELGVLPPDSVGARNRRDPGIPLRIWFAGLDGPIDTDIGGEHKSLRARSPQRQFFNINGIGDGDQILIEKLDEYEYRFSPLADRTPDQATREQLVWTRDELILALDFYFDVGADTGQPIPGQHTSRIRELSQLVKRLGAYPAERQGPTYRNTNGVYKKLMNLRAVQNGGEHGLTSFGQRDTAIWHEFADDRPRLHAEARALRAQLEHGIIVPASAEARIDDADIEQQHIESYQVSPSGQPRSAVRAEQRLVHRYRDHMKPRGIDVRRKRYVPAGEIRPLYSDAWIEELQLLVEAKNSDSREAMRQAIGQLYDYRRFHQPHPHLAVLLPYKPNADRLDLLQSASIEAIWERRSGFQDSAGGRFV